MLYCFVVVIAVVLFYHQNLNFICWLLLPIIAIIEYILTLGIAFIVSALTVYFRDLEHVMGISLLAWQFLTPVMYPETLVPNDYIKIFMLNPMTPITIAYRDILYYGAFPNWQTIAYALLCSISIFFVGLLIFEKMKRNFAEEL